MTLPTHRFPPETCQPTKTENRETCGFKTLELFIIYFTRISFLFTIGTMTVQINECICIGFNATYILTLLFDRALKSNFKQNVGSVSLQLNIRVSVYRTSTLNYSDNLCYPSLPLYLPWWCTVLPLSLCLSHRTTTNDGKHLMHLFIYSFISTVTFLCWVNGKQSFF